MSSDQYADDRVYLREDTSLVAIRLSDLPPRTEHLLPDTSGVRGGWLYYRPGEPGDDHPVWSDLADDDDDLALPDATDADVAEVVEQHAGPIGVARFDHDHNPVQHRDGRPPWCQVCRRTMTGAYVAPGSSWQRRHGGRP